MTLEKRNIPIDFGGQLDTKTDPKKVMPGNFTLIQNAVRKKGKMFAKRPGSAKIAAPAGATGKGVVDYKGQLIKFEDDKLWARVEDFGSSWIYRGPLVSCVAGAEVMSRGESSYFAADSARSGNYTIYCYSNSPFPGGTSGYYGSLVDIYDEESKTFTLKGYGVSGNGAPRCLAYGDTYLTFSVHDGTNGDLYFYRLRPSDNAILAGGYAIVSTLHKSTDLPGKFPTYDVAQVPNSTDFWVLYSDKVANAVKLQRFTRDGATVGSATTVASDVAYNACALAVTASHVYAVWYQHVGSGSNLLRCAILSHAQASVVAPFTVASVAHPNGYFAATAVGDSAGAGIQVFYAGGSPSAVRTLYVSSAGAVGTAAVISRNALIRSKAFCRTVNGVDSFYACIENASSVQPAYFICREDAYVAAQFRNGLARGTELESFYSAVAISLSSVSEEDADVFEFATIVRERVFLEDGQVSSATAIAKATADFTQGFSCEKVGENLLIAGGKVAMYDGQNVVEQGFHLYPEKVTVSETATGNLDKTKTYRWVLVYEWADNNGLIHRSAPSQPMTYSATAATYKANFAIIPYTFSSKQRVAQVLYRTEGNGSIYYRVSPQILSANSVEISGNSVGGTIQDNISDADLSDNEILYTTGGVLENIAPPNARHVSEFNGRAVLAGTEDGSVWFSKKVGVRIAATFSDSLVIPAPDGEPIKATASIDEKLILLRETGSPYFTYGDGPDNLGSGGFAQPIKMNVDGSLKDAASLINIPNQGLAFNTPQGIYQIGRDLQSFYFGAAVDEWKGATIVGTAIDEKESLVYFFTDESPSLVFDYAWQQWYVFTISGVGCTMYKGAASGDLKVITYIKSNGDVYVGDPTLFKDAGTHYAPKAITGWLTLAGLAGFQRIYRAAFNGKMKEHHTLKIKIGYDNKDTFDSEIQFDASLLDGEQYRIQSHLKKQKCEAIRFSIEEESDGATYLVGIDQPICEANGGFIPHATFQSGQTFVAPSTGVIDRITMYMSSPLGAVGNIFMALYDTVLGLPDGAALGTSSPFNVASLTPTKTAVTFIFPTPVAVVEGTTYAFAFDCNHSSGNFRAWYTATNPYADGTGLSTNDGVTWSTGHDYGFAVNVITPVRGEALEMDSLTLEVGIKRGIAKLRSGLKIPTT